VTIASDLLQQPCGRGTIPRYTRMALAWLAAGMLVLASTPATQAEEPSFVSGVLDFPLSNYYLNPRGLIVEDEGLVFQPSLNLYFNLYQGDGPLSSVTAWLGAWNSVHTKNRPVPPGTTLPNWNEIDFLSGLSFTFLKDWTASISYQYWMSPANAFSAASLLELQLAYSDHFLADLVQAKMSLNPYVRILIELHNKVTVLSTDESFNVEVGMVPKYVLYVSGSYPLTIELPTFLTFPGNDFYTENSVPGVFGTGLRVTAPLTSVPKRYGIWKVYAGLVYEHLFNDGIVADNLALPPRSTDRDPVQCIGGFNLTF
jgi:hypothetical protein